MLTIRCMEAIVVALDFSDATSRVVDAAGKFAKLLKARVVLLHVIEGRDASQPLEGSDTLAMPEGSRTYDSDLKILASSLRQQINLEVDSKIQAGPPVDTILKEAEVAGCGLILLGSHGHGALYELFSGGVVTGILKKSKIPVLVIPVREKEKPSAAAGAVKS